MPRKSSRQSLLGSKRHSPAILSRKRKHERNGETATTHSRQMITRNDSGHSGASVASSDDVQVISSNGAHDDSVIEVVDTGSSDNSTPDREIISGDQFDDTFSKFVSLSCSPCTPGRASPFPFLYWADSREVWNALVKKDRDYKRDAALMSRHPALLARMRSILLDWLIEVCEVYRLHRDTFFLAVDLVDRFLSKERDLPKSQLQLLGITALFVAAKIEEIYPPKLGEFAYVTDEACSEKSILEQELVMLQSLSWQLCPVTPNRWVTTYLQLHVLKTSNHASISDAHIKDPPSFLQPRFSGSDYVQTAKLLDLVVLDIGSLNYPYSVLAAAALSFYMSRKDLLLACGFRWSELSDCVSWMRPFAEVVADDGPAPIKTFSDIPSENHHNIQTHVINLKLLERARTRQKEKRVRTPSESSTSLLTPPKSTHKPAKRARTGSISKGGS